MATTTTAQDNKFRIRQAGPQDIDAVTDVMILSMQEDHGWWDYRFPHRHAYPEDHRKLLRLLVEAWISPDFDDWVVMVAEVHDTPSSSEGYQIACYSAWDVSYLNYRKHGPDYAPQDRKATLLHNPSTLYVPPSRLYPLYLSVAVPGSS